MTDDDRDRLLPLGGMTGQILVKESPTDGDASWQSPNLQDFVYRNQVESIIRSMVADWALEGNSTEVPVAKIPNY